MAKRKPQSGGEVPEWVVTYGDLMSLLLCFFILLAAFSELKKEDQYREVLESIQEALGFRGGFGVNDSLNRANNSSVSWLEEAARRADNKLETDINNESNVTGQHDKVNVVQEGQIFAIGGSVTFDEGSANLTRSAQDLLRMDIAPKIRGERFIVRIVGHAWGERDRRGGISYDELGYKRAEGVKDFLVRECDVDPMILRVETAGNNEPVSPYATSVELPPDNRRVQVWKTGRVVEDTHPDPNYTGASAEP